MVSMGFSLLPHTASGEDIAAPFVVRDDGYFAYMTTLDQSREDSTGSYTVMPPYFYAQTFIPTASGNLSIVSVEISYPVGVTLPVRCEIRSTLGGFPAGTGGVLTWEEDVCTIGPAPSWIDITFSSPVHVTDGVAYAIVVYTSGIFWSGGCTSLGGDGFESDDNSETWAALSESFAYRVYLDLPHSADIKKIAWHPSGNFALGVTGDNSAIWEYYRELGEWSVAVADFGHVLRDIIHEPVWDRFYAVGDDGGEPSSPVAWEINPYNQPMTRTFMGSPAGVSGSFHGACVASEGVGPYAFLAVGGGSSYAIACWFQMGSGWVNANGGDMGTSDGHVLYGAEAIMQWGRTEATG
jgi:hypothetical protein